MSPLMTTAIPKQEIRILVADDEVIRGDRLLKFLESHGFQTRSIRSGADLKTALYWEPHIILYDLMLPELNAISFLKQAQSKGLLENNRVRVFIMSGHTSPKNMQECAKYGASEYLTKPIQHADLLARLVFHLQEKRELSEPNDARLATLQDQPKYFSHITDLLLKEAVRRDDVEECLHNLTKMVAAGYKAVRVSAIKCDAESRKGLVIASSDKRDIASLEINLAKYPEVMYVLRSEKLLALDNLSTDPTMHFVTRKDKSIIFNSMLVAPIRVGSRIWGVLSIRMGTLTDRLTEPEIRFAQVAGNVAGLVVARDPMLVAPIPAPAQDSDDSSAA